MKKVFVVCVLLLVAWGGYALFAQSNDGSESVAHENGTVSDAADSSAELSQDYSDLDPTALTKEDFISHDVCFIPNTSEDINLLLPPFVSWEDEGCFDVEPGSPVELQYNSQTAVRNNSRLLLHDPGVLSYEYKQNDRPIVVIYNTISGYVAYWRRFSPSIENIKMRFFEPYLIITESDDDSVVELVDVYQSKQIVLDCERAYHTVVFSPINSDRAVFWCDGMIQSIDLDTGESTDVFDCPDYDTCVYQVIGWQNERVLWYARKDQVVGRKMLQGYTIDISTGVLEQYAEFSIDNL